MQILAWIDVAPGKREHPHIACWVSSDSPDRPPATHAFRTLDGARAWVLFEAGQLGVAASDIRWISTPQTFK